MNARDANPPELDESRWEPPQGPDLYWRIRSEAEDGRLDFEVSALVPDEDETIEFSEAKLERIGGPSARDDAARSELYHWIGRATVAGGKIEAAMKRLLLALDKSQKPSFANVDKQWSELDRRLRRAAKDFRPRNQVVDALVEALDWAIENRVKERRDSIVHAYWWDYADTMYIRARFYRDGTSPLIMGTLEAMKDDVDKLASYADRLDRLTSSVPWLQFYLPRED